ncbi:MAG TPA: zf-TFIIB domain-containing protein [Candidatus Nanoarchaeia archaeon]|nr:zf-TFIIB domain-containing protein [Candidatus Nanoarchaeia archaeon]
MEQHAKLGCPRCSGLFRKRVMRKITHPSGAILDVCDSCGGMWLDAPEVKLLYAKSKKRQSKRK